MAVTARNTRETMVIGGNPHFNPATKPITPNTTNTAACTMSTVVETELTTVGVTALNAPRKYQ
jgi:hypothetical protein